MTLFFLMELEIRSQRNIISMFNIMGGTSFGSIIIACLNCPTVLNSKKPLYLTKDIVSKWTKLVKTAFDKD